MVFAKSSKGASRLSEQMRTGDFEKKYLTVLTSVPRERKAFLTHYLKKNAVNNMVYVSSQAAEGAKMAQLDYTVLDEKDGNVLTEVRLHTGRSHQIRVQMSAIGCPVYGDMRYGGEKAKKGYLALWAYSLAFTHPVTGERMVFKVQPPKDVNPWTGFDTDACVQVVKPEV
jgi:23S rRNA pseudouridine1911/1915/1917 synthase